MTEVARRFEVVEGGAAIPSQNRIAEPLGNLDFWLRPDDLAVLADVSDRAARKAISARKWRGFDLLVRVVEIGRGGAGGKALQVHVDSLPNDLREDWYLERGIKLHEKRDPTTGQMVMVPAQAWNRDARHERALGVARWRHDVIKPALALPKQSMARSQMLDDLAMVIRTWPNGQKKAVIRRTLYNWVQAFERGDAGLAGLMPKVRGIRDKADHGDAHVGCVLCGAY